jgi:hypothetical protein
MYSCIYNIQYKYILREKLHIHFIDGIMKQHQYLCPIFKNVGKVPP